jgi:hypothetical protein
MIVYLFFALVTLGVLGYCYGRYDWYNQLHYMPRIVLLFVAALWFITVPLILSYIGLNYLIKFGEKHS